MIWYRAMFLKLLLTALVIAGALLTLRARRQRALSPAPPLLPAARRKSQLPLKIAAIGLVGLMLAGAAAYLYYQWRDNYQVVTLQVIDTRSGNRTTYQAYRKDVEGRSFLTTDGRRVTLAEVERLEIGAR
jgi:hypothetical protein